MDEIPPLGALDAFRNWSGSRSWGPGDRWRATFGGGVVADLVEGLRGHPNEVAKRFSAKAEAYPVVLGCVPWISSDDVVDALVAVGSCCVVVDKSARNTQLDRLTAEGTGVRQMLLHGLEYWGPHEGGRPPVIDPSSASAFEERELAPVRVLGWRKGKQPVPLLHAKLAVCCAAYGWEGEFASWNHSLAPLSVWMGSANWTNWSPKHLEFGAWTTDQALATAALEFIRDVIKSSEPRSSTAPHPSPELVEGKWDDDAFAELAREALEATEEDEA